MTSQQWQEIDRLFQHAVELDPEARKDFLEEACKGNRSLREEVDSLLASDAGASNLIDQEVLAHAAPFLAVDFPRLDEGQKLGNYEIVKLIGRGGMGEVFLAKDEVLNRRIALKLLPADYTTHPERLRRFQQEALAVSALNHPNILTIHELRQVEDLQFIATEFVDGETLRERMNRQGLGLSQIVDIAVQIASALTAAHEANIIHRDIKPENIMLRRDGYVKVLDFGLAKLKEYVEASPAAETHADAETSSALVLGTVKYMSPEQAQGLPVDARSDVFSLGVVLYEMLAGHAPFQGETPTAVMESVLHREPQSLAAGPLNIPKGLARTVEKALNKNRGNRYADANEFLSDLKEAKHELDLESKFSTLSPSTLAEVRIRPIQTQHASSFLSLSTAHPVAFIALVLIAMAIGAAILFFRPPKRRPASLGAWSEKAPMPKPRAGAAVAALDGQLYVVSGTDASGTTDAVEVYDPTTDRWTSRANIPTGRTAAGADAIAGKLYVFGGCGRNSEGNHDCRVGTTNAMEAYDPQTNTWTTKAPMPTARSAVAATVIGGKLYVAGGRGPCPPCTPYRLLEIYDSATDTWDRNGAPLPIAVSGAGGAALNGKFFVVGGEAGMSELNRASLLASYDPATNRWQLEPPMPTPRAELGLEAVHGVLYAIGGVALEESNVVEAFDPTQNTWSTKAPLPFPRMSPLPVAIDGVIYVAGSGGLFNQPSPILHAYTAVCPGSTCISSPPNLIGWWPGDGDANDLSGRNHGKVEGNITLTSGKVGRAFNLDGLSFVTIGNPPALNLNGNQVTMSGWINPRVNAPAIYFGKTRYGANDFLLAYGRGVDAMVNLNGYDFSVLGYSDFPSKTQLYIPPIGEWTHVAMTYDGATISLYANGKIVGQGSSSGTIGRHDVPFNIGGRADDQGTGKFNGLIDEVQVFNRALSAGEIRMIFEAGSDGQCKPQARCR